MDNMDEMVLAKKKRNNTHKKYAEHRVSPNNCLLILLVVCMFFFVSCGSEGDWDSMESFLEGSNESMEENSEQTQEYLAQMDSAVNTPYGKYPELITYTLGKMTGSNNSNLPEGDTYEDNAYTRFLQTLLNVQNKNVFEEQDTQYDSNVSIAIASGSLPDIITVSSLEDLRLLIEYDLIEDLTEEYENCMSETIKEMYNSYGNSIMDVVTFDGKIMAIPETNIEDGPNLIWLRKDWMDELSLEEPKNLADAEYIISQFIEKDPGGNGVGNTIGLVCDPSMSGECGYSSEYLLDIVFASYGAYPKQWIYDDEGNVVYGSIQPEAKEALLHIREMYETGILDNNFLLRTSSNIIELVTNNQCGSFFGPWWAPNNPLMEAIAQNPEAEWMPYLLATNEDGSTSYYSQNPTYKYVVVRKGYEHPEIVCKIISALFDYGRNEEDDNQEFREYFQNNVDPTARPIAINVDYKDALSNCYVQVASALEGKTSPEDLNLLEFSYYEACKGYLDSKKYLENKEYNENKEATPEQWAAYASRITACKLIAEGDLREVQSLFFDETETMTSEWWKLENKEKQTYLQIVTGDVGIEVFDEFVLQWKGSGGDTITNEVQESVRVPSDKAITTAYKADETRIDDNYGTCYQVFLYSFCDSNGDGIGDIQGLISKLDYIDNLGCDSIWLLPIHPSTTYHKYDVVDYFSIDSEYGTMEDFEELVLECEQRNIDIYMDFVMNHTSAKHPWFTEAEEYLKSLEEGQKPDSTVCPYVEYYNFVQADTAPLNYSKVNGTKDWYYESVFWDQMPDLNLDNETVRREIETIASFWIDKGVKGFRLDAALHYYESNTEKSTEALQWFNDYVKEMNPEIYCVAEIWDSYDTIKKFYESGIDSLFNFVLGNQSGLFVKAVNRNGNGKTGLEYAQNLVAMQTAFTSIQPNYIDGVFLSNHDTGRAAGFLSKDVDKVKLAAGLQLLSTGSVYVYYGEELGMSGSGIDENKRAPMYWTEETEGVGMTKGPSAMEVQEHKFGSLEVQQDDMTSIYQYYKKAIHLRNKYPHLARGTINIMEEVVEQDGNICAIAKTYDGEVIYLLYNINSEPTTVQVSKQSYEYDGIVDYLCTGTEIPVLEGDTLTIPSYGCVILQ